MREYSGGTEVALDSLVIPDLAYQICPIKRKEKSLKELGVDQWVQRSW